MWQKEKGVCKRAFQKIFVLLHSPVLQWTWCGEACRLLLIGGNPFLQATASHLCACINVELLKPSIQDL